MDIQEIVSENRHSDDINEIITKVPSWIVRWGIVLLSFILLLALSISAVIRYPDIIKIPVKLQTSNNAKETFGLSMISQEDFIKVKPGQEVLINLRFYPLEEYGQLRGTVIYIANEPGENGLFAVKIKLNIATMKHPVNFKSWMTGQARIITKQDITLLKRISQNITILNR